MPSVSVAGRRLRRRHATRPTCPGLWHFNPIKSELISRRWRRVALAAASPQAAAEPRSGTEGGKIHVSFKAHGQRLWRCPEPQLIGGGR